MVQFWKDVAVKAPHHSRASWMKYWRRHKHEFNRTEEDAPLPPAPEKKMRYSRQDDILLAKYFYERPAGTSDSIFQTFGRKVRVLLYDIIYNGTKADAFVVNVVPASSMERLARASSDT